MVPLSALGSNKWKEHNFLNVQNKSYRVRGSKWAQELNATYQIHSLYKAT